MRTGNTDSFKHFEVDQLVLAAVLPTVITALRRNQIGFIQDELIEGLVAVGWLRRIGGGLEVTSEGALVAEDLRVKAPGERGPRRAASSRTQNL